MDFVNICRKALYFRGSLSICPAYAGMILLGETIGNTASYLSRVCGDDPHCLVKVTIVYLFVPRMRG